MGLISKEATVWLMMPSYNSWPKNCFEKYFLFIKEAAQFL